MWLSTFLPLLSINLWLLIFLSVFPLIYFVKNKNWSSLLSLLLLLPVFLTPNFPFIDFLLIVTSIFLNRKKGYRAHSNSHHVFSAVSRNIASYILIVATLIWSPFSALATTLIYLSKSKLIASLLISLVTLNILLTASIPSLEYRQTELLTELKDQTVHGQIQIPLTLKRLFYFHKYFYAADHTLRESAMRITPESPFFPWNLQQAVLERSNLNRDIFLPTIDWFVLIIFLIGLWQLNSSITIFFLGLSWLILAYSGVYLNATLITLTWLPILWTTLNKSLSFLLETKIKLLIIAIAAISIFTRLFFILNLWPKM